LKVAFLMDPLEGIDPAVDTTSHLMYECNQRGHRVYFLEPYDVYIRSNEVVARMRNISVPPDQSMPVYWQCLIACLNKEELIFEALSDLDVLFLRKNPPLIYQTLEFLQLLNGKVFMVNNTVGQMLGNSKLYTLNFPDLIPKTHVSRDPKRLIGIIEDFGGAMIVKPLQRFGGEGVIKLSILDRENLTSLINYYTLADREYARREPIMVQEYLQSVRAEGDVRILLLNGEFLGAMRRIPQKSTFHSAYHSGSSVSAHEITPGQSRICSSIRDRLLADGLYFVGIDVIGDQLVDVNCISPGGLPQINRLNKVRLEKKIIDFVEKNATETKSNLFRAHGPSKMDSMPNPMKQDARRLEFGFGC
jgi:glutathione synthase